MMGSAHLGTTDKDAATGTIWTIRGLYGRNALSRNGPRPPEIRGSEQGDLDRALVLGPADYS